MASGGRREFSVQRDNDGEPSNTELDDASVKTRQYDCDTGRSFNRGGSNARKREDVSRSHRREVYTKSKSPGRGRGGQRKASGDTFQLEPANVGNGRRAQSSSSPRQRQEYDDRNAYKSKRSSSEKPLGKLGGVMRDQDHPTGQQKKQEKQEVPLQQIKRCEEKIAEVLRQWKGDRAGYHLLESHAAHLWSQYQNLLLRNMEQAVKENLSWRVWRCSQYPVIETLRKSGQRKPGSIARQPLLVLMWPPLPPAQGSRLSVLWLEEWL